jgi:hypothetical protein
MLSDFVISAFRVCFEFRHCCLQGYCGDIFVLFRLVLFLISLIGGFRPPPFPGLLQDHASKGPTAEPVPTSELLSEVNGGGLSPGGIAGMSLLLISSLQL